MSTENLKIAKVTWIDSFGGGGWVDKETYTHQVSTCYTVGYVIKDAQDFLTIASTVSKDQYLDPISIPRCAIQKLFWVPPEKEKPETQARPIKVPNDGY